MLCRCMRRAFAITYRGGLSCSASDIVSRPRLHDEWRRSEQYGAPPSTSARRLRTHGAAAASIGGATFAPVQNRAKTAEALMRDADAALSSAKAGERHQVRGKDRQE